MSDYKVVPVDVREALKAMYDAAHPAYVADEHFRDKLIQAREKARAVLESAPAPSGEAVELVDKLMYATAHAANSLGAAYRVNRRAADEARAALFAAITHPPVAEREPPLDATVDWVTWYRRTTGASLRAAVDERNRRLVAPTPGGEAMSIRDFQIRCHADRDISNALAEAMARLPACPLNGLVSGALQEIEALRYQVAHPPAERDAEDGVHYGYGTLNYDGVPGSKVWRFEDEAQKAADRWNNGDDNYRVVELRAFEIDAARQGEGNG